MIVVIVIVIIEQVIVIVIVIVIVTVMVIVIILVRVIVQLIIHIIIQNDKLQHPAGRRASIVASRSLARYDCNITSASTLVAKHCGFAFQR